MHDRKEFGRSPKTPLSANATGFFTRLLERSLRAIGAHLERLGRAARIEAEKPIEARKKIYTRTLRERTGFRFGALRVERRVIDRGDYRVEVGEVVRRGWGFERKSKRAVAMQVWKFGRQLVRTQESKEAKRVLHTRDCEQEKRTGVCSCGQVLRVKVKGRTHDYWERKGLKRPERVK